MTRYIAYRTQVKQCQLYKQANYSYRTTPYWMSYLFTKTLSHLQVMVDGGCQHREKGAPSIYKGAFM